MTAQEERLIGRLTKAVWLLAVTGLVGGTLAFAELQATASDAQGEVEDLRPRVDRVERRVDSLLIELRHLPSAIVDTLEARERRRVP
jgi:hypothetical protein